MRGKDFCNGLHKAGAIAASSIALFGVSGEASATTAPENIPASASDLNSRCDDYLLNPKYHNHEYEACYAYTIDMAGYQELGQEFGALSLYYAFSQSPSSLKRDLWTHHFKTRYFLSARQQIEKRVTQFPVGEYFVDNHMVVRGVTASLKTNRAIIKTTENWVVANSEHGTVYQEKARNHVSTLCRIKEKGFPHFLHEWVKVADSAQPNFNCNAFGKAVYDGRIR